MDKSPNVATVDDLHNPGAVRSRVPKPFISRPTFPWKWNYPRHHVMGTEVIHTMRSNLSAPREGTDQSVEHRTEAGILGAPLAYCLTTMDDCRMITPPQELTDGRE